MREDSTVGARILAFLRSPHEMARSRGLQNCGLPYDHMSHRSNNIGGRIVRSIEIFSLSVSHCRVSIRFEYHTIDLRSAVEKGNVDRNEM